jgi:SNF2 family DNA or RNA helicase
MPSSIKSEISHHEIMHGKPETVLYYGRGKFWLETENKELRSTLNKDAHWKNEDLLGYSTESLAAAVRYREFADGPASRILARRLQAFYPGVVRQSGESPFFQALAPHLDPHLDPHQAEGLAWVMSRKRSYLAHAPGAGKTITALAGAYLALEKEPGCQAVLIVPPTLVANWVREISRVSGWLDIWPSVGVIRAGFPLKRVPVLADLVLVADSMLSHDGVYRALLKRRKCFLAVDEASRFKDPFAARSIRFYGGIKDGQSFPGLYRDATHVVFLDGSPMPNRPMELWGPTFALDPEAIDCLAQDDFGYRYCGAKPNERGQWEYLWSSHEAELQARLQKTFMHVVREEELSHPERLRQLLYIPKDIRRPDQREWERKNITDLTFDQLKDGMDKGDIASYRKDLGLQKVPFIAKYTRMRLEKNEAVLLFVWHREVANELCKLLSDCNPGLIYGGTTTTAREAWITAFQTGKTRLLILNIAASGRGHNLQKADRVIFGEYSWTDEQNRQCEKRASRRGK